MPIPDEWTDEWDLRPKWRFGMIGKLALAGLTAAGVIVLAIMLLVAVEVGCTAPDETRDTLIKAGYTDIEVKGHSWLECGKGDTFATRFAATNSNGLRISGTVCCGLATKGCTIRY